MSVIYLKITGFRNIDSAEILPHAEGFNCISGKNASGKTSLLESIYYLSLARSFRSNLAPRVIGYDHTKLSVFAHIQEGINPIIDVGLERNQEGVLKARMNEKWIQAVSDMAEVLPVQLIHAECHNLLVGGPLFRRQYLDWILFYLNPGFMQLWKQFGRILSQRNAALKSQLSKNELAGWTLKLKENALALDQCRESCVTLLIPILKTLLTEILPLPNMKLEYYRGWEGESYASALNRSLEQDRRLGYTQAGPHRADLRLLINDIPAKDILSRGQQKLFVCAMILARGVLLQKNAAKRPIYLIDDLPSELDIASRASLIALLSKQDAQIFVTAAESKVWNEFSTGSPVKMFHVEHGKILTAQ